MNAEEAEYGLVMPFVLVESVGGPYDDEAFTVGWEMGELNAWLETSPPNGSKRLVHDTTCPQVDLLAMRHGYEMWVAPPTTEGWYEITFRRPGPDDPRQEAA